MKRFIRFSLIFTILAIIVSSCLTVEKKIYTFQFTGKNSGTLSIKYINLMSMSDYNEDEDGNAVDNSGDDFDDLIVTYLNGTTIEETYPLATNVQKRLFEENGQLCGEVTMDFPNIEAARLYQFSKKSPICFSISNTIDGEYFESTNGTLGNSEFMNVVFWAPGTKTLTVTTGVTEPSEDTQGLLSHYKKWKK
jgi:hypothetical protein